MQEEISEQYKKNLLENLAGKDYGKARAAAFEVAKLNIHDALHVLVGSLQAPNVGLQEAAEYALRKIRGADAVQYLAPLIRIDDVLVRNTAMDILREICTDNIKVLYELVHDDNVDIRVFAADILGYAGGVAVPILADVFRNDSDVNVRYQACVSLGVLGEHSAIEVLKSALYDDEWIQFAAIEALVKIQARDSVEVLVHKLKECSELIACKIIEALGEMEAFCAIPIVLARLDENNILLRNTAIKALVQILGAPSFAFVSKDDLDKINKYLLVAINDESKGMLIPVITGLSFFKNSESTRAIIQRMYSLDSIADTDIFSAIKEALVAIGYNDVLKEAISSDNETIFRVILDVCASIPSRQCVDILVSVFFNLSLDNQEFIVERLALMADHAEANFFVKLLEEYSSSITIAMAACTFFERYSIPVEHRPLVTKLLYHPNRETRLCALGVVLSFNDEDLNKEVVGLYFSDSPQNKELAVRAMGSIDINAYFDQLLDVLQDQDIHVRDTALNILGSICIEQPEFFKTLKTTYENSQDNDILVLLLDIAGPLTTEDALSFIVKMVFFEDNWVCIRAVDSIQKYQKVMFVPDLIRRLDSADILVTIKILEALGVLGGKEAFQALLGYISHPNIEVQEITSKSIGMLKRKLGGL